MNFVVRKLNENDAHQAVEVTRAMATVFEEGAGVPADHLSRLLKSEQFWLFGAFSSERAIGGLTAHVIPVTREIGFELFIYDIAVAQEFQRQGVGRKLMQAAIDEAEKNGLLGSFVPAESDDQDALDFYRGIGGSEQLVSIFNF